MRDVDAYQIALNADPSLTEAERQYAVAVARGEGGYGAGWAHPSARTIELSSRFGLTGFEGSGSNNWGAEQGSGDAGRFKHVDTHADGSPYVANYKRHSSPEQGFRAFARILLKDNVRAALNSTGSLRDAVFAQHANRYFELNPEQYLKAVARNYAALVQNAGLTPVLSEAGTGASFSVVPSADSGAIPVVGAVLIVAAGVVSYMGYTGKLFNGKKKG